MVAALNSDEKFGWSSVIAPFEFKTSDNCSRARKSRTHALRTEAALASSRKLFSPQSAPVSQSRCRDEISPSNTRSANHDVPAPSTVAIIAPLASSSIPPGIQAANPGRHCRRRCPACRAASIRYVCTESDGSEGTGRLTSPVIKEEFLKDLSFEGVFHFVG